MAEELERRINEEVSVLFNEPKLLKCLGTRRRTARIWCFSALQRAEIAEIEYKITEIVGEEMFQCSSTSRNC